MGRDVGGWGGQKVRGTWESLEVLPFTCRVEAGSWLLGGAAFPSPEPFPSTPDRSHLPQLSPMLTQNNERLSDSMEAGGGS